MSGGGIQRRTAALRLAWGALLPFAALGSSLARAHGLEKRIAIPTGAYRLERILTRGLSDGAAIVVTRHWRISFAPATAGIVVSGMQTFVDVTAPAVLAPLAAIERARSASSLFPLMIDEAGLIRSSDQAENGDSLVRALETGRALVNSLPLPETARLDARSFMAHLSTLSAGAVSRLPRDLFFPQAGEDTTARDVVLPGGETGTILVISHASAVPGSGLLLQSERRIVTRLAASERVNSERWTLTES